MAGRGTLITISVAPLLPLASVQPDTAVLALTAKHSSVATVSSPLSAAWKKPDVPVVSPASTVRVVGGFAPTSSAVAFVSVAPSHRPVGTLVPSSRSSVNSRPPSGAGTLSSIWTARLPPGVMVYPGPRNIHVFAFGVLLCEADQAP